MRFCTDVDLTFYISGINYSSIVIKAKLQHFVLCTVIKQPYILNSKIRVMAKVCKLAILKSGEQNNQRDPKCSTSSDCCCPRAFTREKQTIVCS